MYIAGKPVKVDFSELILVAVNHCTFIFDVITNGSTFML